MLARFLAGPVFAAGLLVTSGQVLAYQPDLDRDGGSFFGALFGNLMTSGSPAAKTVVSFPENHRPGTIVISTNERRLYYVLGNGQAIRYGIGVGRDGFTWSGVRTVSSKREWPDWTPPEQ